MAMNTETLSIPEAPQETSPAVDALMSLSSQNGGQETLEPFTCLESFRILKILFAVSMDYGSRGVMLEFVDQTARTPRFSNAGLTGVMHVPNGEATGESEFYFEFCLYKDKNLYEVESAGITSLVSLRRIMLRGNSDSDASSPDTLTDLAFVVPGLSGELVKNNAGKVVSVAELFGSILKHPPNVHTKIWWKLAAKAFGISGYRLLPEAIIREAQSGSHSMTTASFVAHYVDDKSQLERLFSDSAAAAEDSVTLKTMQRSLRVPSKRQAFHVRAAIGVALHNEHANASIPMADNDKMPERVAPKSPEVRLRAPVGNNVLTSLSGGKSCFSQPTRAIAQPPAAMTSTGVFSFDDLSYNGELDRSRSNPNSWRLNSWLALPTLDFGAISSPLGVPEQLHHTPQPSFMPQAAPAPAMPTPPAQVPPSQPVSRPSSRRMIESHWPDKWLDMKCIEFNRFIKSSKFTDEQVADLKRARRRKLNRLYAQRSRQRKAEKLGMMSEEVGAMNQSQVQVHAQVTVAPVSQAPITQVQHVQQVQPQGQPTPPGPEMPMVTQGVVLPGAQ
eukprot:m.7636 g.7636  ORF g.7636 m.7636 type:complete len:559 (+) comp5267_c0_seq1:209-1885(+)